jgi:hypothetical protein
MKTIKKLAFLGALLLAFTLTAQSAKLQYNLNKGDKYLVEINMKQNMAPIMDMDITVSINMTTTGVNGNSIETESKMGRMKMDMSAQGESVNFDSDKSDNELSEEEKKMKADLAPAMEMIMYQTMSKTGKMLSYKMVPEVKGAAAVLNQNQFLFVEYPTSTAKVGTKWGQSQSMNGMNMKIEYVVTEITSDKVFADVTGSLDGTTEAKIRGKLIIDRASGMALSNTIDMSVEAMGTTMGMKVSVTAKKL